VKEGVAIGQAGVGAGEGGIDHDGLREHLHRGFQGFAAELVEELPAAKVVIVGLEVSGRRPLDGAFLFLTEDHLQRLGDILGDVLLDGENVLQLAVVGFRPDAVSVGDVHELGADPQPVARLADTSF
jgi:hypothetical protein